MDRKSTQTIDVFPASGGLNKTFNPVQLNFNELTEANNIIYNLKGTCKKRYGIKNYVTDIGVNWNDGVWGIDYWGDGITDSSNLRGLFSYWRNVNNVQTQRIIAFINGKLYADNEETSGIFRDITGTSIIGNNDMVTFDVFVGALIIAFKSTTPKLWTMSGNIQELSVTAPNGNIYRTHLGSGWIAGVASNRHVVFKSDTGNPLSWSGLTADYFDLDLGDGDPVGVTGLFPSFFGDLYVSKYNSIYRIRPAGTTFSVSPVVKGLGCINHNTAVAINNDIVFVSDRGIHSLSTVQSYGDTKSAFLSAKIHEYFRDTVDISKAENMWAIYASEINSYLLSYTKVGEKYNKHILGLDLSANRWFEWKNVDCAAISNYINSSGHNTVMMGGYSGRIGYLDKNTSVDFDETPISCQYKTGYIYPFNKITKEAGFKSVSIHYIPKGDYNFQFSYKIDNQSTITVDIPNNTGDGDKLDDDFILDESELDEIDTFKTYKHDINGYGRGIQISFDSNPTGTNDEDLETLGFSLEIEDAGETNKEVTV